MNPITRIAASINRIANINNVNRTVKEDKIMNTTTQPDARHSSIARFARQACTLIAFAGLLGLSHAAARADVVVEWFEGPQDVYNDANNYVAPGTTAMQLKIHNTFNYAVSGVPVQTYIYFATDVNNGWQVRAMPAASVSLAANQTKWITIVIPDTSLQGQSLRGKYLYAKALMSGHEYWLNNFLDAAYNLDALETNRIVNVDGSVTFTLRFTNNGHISSPPMNVTVNYAPYAGGDLGPKTPLTTTLPLLGPAQSAIRTFTTRSLTNFAYDYIDSDLYLGTDQVFHQFRL